MSLNLKHLFDRHDLIPLDSRYEKTVDWNALQQEASALSPYFVEHSYGDLSGWQALSLHGLDVAKTENARNYGYPGGDLSLEAKRDMRWTTASLVAPQMTAFIKSLPFCELYRVRLFKMSPGGYVGWHGDEGWNGTEDLIDHYTLMVAVHAPHNSCLVFANGSKYNYNERRSALINFNRWHCATNPSNENRFMIKIHGKITPEFLIWVQESMTGSPSVNNEVLWCVWDPTLKDDWLRNKCRQITLISIPPERTRLGADPDSLLEENHGQADYLVIVKAGTFVDNPSAIEKRILEIQPNFFGHILDYKNEYPFLHDQFLVVRTEKWRELGRPPLASKPGESHDLSAYLASTHHFHDDYTPTHLDPASGLQPGVVRFGSQLISATLASGERFHNVPAEIRENKLFLYPHHGSEDQLRLRWKGQDESIPVHENHDRFLKTYYKKGKEQRSFWPYNSESMADVFDLLGTDLNHSFDMFLGPASGLKLEFAMSRLSSGTINRVLFFDLSREQLEFKKSLWHDWSGEPYEEFVEAYRERKGIPLAGRLLNKYYKDLTLLPWYNDHKLYESFCKVRERVVSVDFLPLDLISDYERLWPYLEDSKSPLFWVSNIFQFIYNHMRYDAQDILTAQQRIEQEVRHKRGGAILGELLADSFFKNFYVPTELSETSKSR